MDKDKRINDVQEHNRCDISIRETDGDTGSNPIDPDDDGRICMITYSLETGQWNGDDNLGDGNGYGHVSGEEDGSNATDESTGHEDDCELWFNIYLNDNDGDDLTFWEEVNVYDVPGHRAVPDRMDWDEDEDDVPSWWEDKYGYDPTLWNLHDDEQFSDPDDDDIYNLHEYRTSYWNSDPFCKDIFVEVDWMGCDLAGILECYGHRMEVDAQRKVIQAFSRHNISLHIDDGWANGGTEITHNDPLPFNHETDYDFYDIKNGEDKNANGVLDPGEDENNNGVIDGVHFARDRLGIFHYAIIGHTYREHTSSSGRADWHDDFFIAGAIFSGATAMAGTFMHELGHNLGLGDQDGWNHGYGCPSGYKSCMNYDYQFTLVDYHDGSGGFYDDWGTIDLTRVVDYGK